MGRVRHAIDHADVGTWRDTDYSPSVIISITKSQDNYPPRGIKIMELQEADMVQSIYVVFETVAFTARIPSLLFTLDAWHPTYLSNEGLSEKDAEKMKVYRQYQKYNALNMRRMLCARIDDGATVRSVHEVLGGHKDLTKEDLHVLTKSPDFDALCAKHGERYIA